MFRYLLLIVIGAFYISSCSKDDPIIPNEEELITTVIYTLTPMNSSESVEMKFQDLDGDGSMSPVISNPSIKTNTTYTGTLSFLNEQASPTENITNEVLAEAEDHQVFYNTSASGVAISYLDQDSDGNPLGLSTQLTTGSASSGQLTITLRHEPNKSASGVSEGNLTNAGGQTDIEVTFALNVEE